MSNQAGDLEPWRIHGDRVVYDNPWVQLALVDVEPPGVPRFEHHVVRLKRVAIAAVLDSEDRVLMLWRYRFVPNYWGWELPGGIVDPGEDGRQAALREVEEETGWRPDGLDHVVTFQPMVGMVDSPTRSSSARERPWWASRRTARRLDSSRGCRWPTFRRSWRRGS